MKISRSIMCAVVLSMVVWLTAPPGSAGAVTALMMGGTSQPHPDQVNGYMDTTAHRYLDPASICKVGSCNLTPVYIPNEASPIWTDGMAFGPSAAIGTGLLETAVRTVLAQTTEQIVVFGNSQSATVAIEVKRLLGADPGVDPSRVSFVVIGNPNRPNGGFMQRFFPAEVPVLEYVPKAPPVHDTGMTTTDIAFHYDIAADFPRYPLNFLAVLNVFAGMAVHGAYDDKVNPNGYTEEELLAEINKPENRTVIGDTTYVTIPMKVLPLAQALRDTGYTTGTSALLNPLADFLEPVLRVIVELGYDRSLPPGAQRSFGLLPAVNPLKVAADIGNALGVGFRNMVTNIGARQSEPAEQRLVPATSPLSQSEPAAELLSTPTSTEPKRTGLGSDVDPDDTPGTAHRRMLTLAPGHNLPKDTDQDSEPEDPDSDDPQDGPAVDPNATGSDAPEAAGEQQPNDNETDTGSGTADADADRPDAGSTESAAA